MLSDLHTKRLVLRQWRDHDREMFATMNADPLVMEHFPSLISREDSDAMVARIQKHWDEHGFGLWAVEVVGGPSFIGFVGLMRPSFTTHFTPCVEVGWRLHSAHWGNGYATEGARAALHVGFSSLGLGEIVAMTVPANHRSIRVMEKLGMLRDPRDDFDHPRIDEPSPLRRHVLYRLRAPMR